MTQKEKVKAPFFSKPGEKKKEEGLEQERRMKQRENPESTLSTLSASHIASDGKQRGFIAYRKIHLPFNVNQRVAKNPRQSRDC